ncbi:MAG TPA: hypothetical protein VFK05_28470 [Polyangiaceae bacterium]|nr:hypothetical protein [Polyangiaceae bacterium]
MTAGYHPNEEAPSNAAQSSVTAKWVSFAPYLLSALRIIAAFMFMLAGTSKLFAFPAAMPGAAHPSLLSQCLGQ